MFNQINTKKQGDVGVGIAIGYFASQGFTVSIPLTDSQDYDLVVEINGKLNKVQVKTTSYKTRYGIYEVGLKICGGNSGKVLKQFDTNDCDYLFVLCCNGDKYLIPRNEIKSKNSIGLGKDREKFKVNGNIGQLAA